jgi:hypothetical protein
MTEHVARTVRRDLRSTGGGARRGIPWDDFDAAGLSDRDRAKVGAAWAHRRRQEHLAVGAFALLARELAEDGCDAIVLSLVTRASSDEVRHAEICRQFAVALLGRDRVSSRVRGLPQVPMHGRARPADRVLLHVAEMCCISETLTGVYLTEMLARTTDPVARAVVESLLEDEIDHGRVGWAYLAERKREGRLQPLAEALPELVDRTIGPVMNTASRAKPHADEDLERFGYLGPWEAGRIYSRTLRDVILPGFETLGIRTTVARSLARERGWFC